MNVLALDTCFAACSVAVAIGASGEARRVVSDCVAMETGHAEALMPMIQRVLASAGIAASRLNRIIVTHGPGTFTGVRIGVAAARALGLATGATVIGVSSTRAIGYRAARLHGGLDASCDGVLVAMDARKGQVYAQVIGADGVELTEPRLLSPEAAGALCPERRVMLVGSGAASVRAAAVSSGRELLIAPPQIAGPDSCFLNAESLLDLVVSSAPEGHVAPLYLRPADAKAQEGKSLAWRGAP